MDRPTVAVACALLTLLAGCAGPIAPPTPATPTEGTSARPGAAASTVTVTADAGTPPASNPWGTGPIVVAVDEERTGAVRDAARYWERVDDRYLGYAVEYAVRPDAPDPDLVVRFVDDVAAECSGTADAAGCAPLVRSPTAIDRPARVYVRTGLSEASTRLVVKHELGHTLGLGHDDDPSAVMAARSVLYTAPRPDAVDRALPWADPDLSVAVDVGNASDPDRARRQVRHALDYIEAGPEGVPANVTFRRVDGDADVTVRVGAGCSTGNSCVRTQGTDPDGDGRIERYTRVEIRTDGLDTAAVGWHVGYWLSYGLGAEADAEKPPPFRSASYEERRSAWWR